MKDPKMIDNEAELIRKRTEEKLSELERDVARIIAAYSFRAPIQVRKWIDKHAEGIAREVVEGLAGEEVWVDWKPDAEITALLCNRITWRGPAHTFNLNGNEHPTSIVGLRLPLASQSEQQIR